jgi:allantoin racemase
MRIKVVIPIVQPLNPEFSPEANLKELVQFKAPDTEIDVVFLPNGPTSIECYYDEVLAAANLLDLVVHAEKSGYDGVYIDCFGDPGVRAARELVEIPVVGAFQPSAMVASLLASRWSIVTILGNVVPMIHDLARLYRVEPNIISVRHINTPVLSFNHADMKMLLLEQIEKAVDEEGAEAIVLGCTGMMGLSQYLVSEMINKGKPVPIVNPSGAAIGYLELLIRNQLSQSPLAYAQAIRTNR